MKIYFLVYNIYGMGGTVRTVVNTANYLAANNKSVEIISLRRISDKPLFRVHPKVKITPLIDVRRGKLYPDKLSLSKKLLKKLLFKLPSILMDSTEDLYHMFNLFSDIKLIRKLRKIKSGILVTTIPSFNNLSSKFVDESVIKIGQEHKYFEGHSKSLQRKIKEYYPKLDAVTCLTDFEINDYKNVIGEENINLYKMENGTDIPMTTSKLDKKVVVAAGRYVPQKGFDLLIPAFSKVIERFPDWKLKIFGSGEDEPMLRELIVKHKAYNNIYLVPTTNNMLNEIANSSMYVLSSRYEPFGMVLIEAMSVGVPCVSFACSGPKEIIENGKDGLLVEEQNIEELSEGMIKLISDTELRKQLGKMAKISAERYSLEKIGVKWESMIADIIKNNMDEDNKSKTSTTSDYTKTITT